MSSYASIFGNLEGKDWADIVDENVEADLLRIKQQQQKQQQQLEQQQVKSSHVANLSVRFASKKAAAESKDALVRVFFVVCFYFSPL